jgi:geranylgeranyl pyrophosphate synthase
MTATPAERTSRPDAKSTVGSNIRNSLSNLFSASPPSSKSSNQLSNASKATSSSPVVVSERAEALSHSATTMKLIPSFELFQLLPEKQGGKAPVVSIGNKNRQSTTAIPDTYSNFRMADYEGVVSAISDVRNLKGSAARKQQHVEKLSIQSLPDPFAMVEDEIQPFSDSIKELVSTDQPILSMAAKHFFEKRQGKRFRPTIIQLLAKAVATVPSTSTTHESEAESTGWGGLGSASRSDSVQISPTSHFGSETWRKQAQLGQIVEMIHVASLIHDDVLDEAETRRGGTAIHKLYSNKVAVLAGDYLLARASVLLARLENTAVVQIMATALESLVAGEIMQLKSPPEALLQMTSYLKKSYYKTASLICYACRSTALLGGHTYASAVATACEEFGFHLGLAYQIVDDILDFTTAATVLGKPALADMDLGLSTAPILYAAQENPSILNPMIIRRFKNSGDKQKALEILYKSPTAMFKAHELALFHAQVCCSRRKRVFIDCRWLPYACFFNFVS